MYLRVPIYLAETEREALSEPEQSIMEFYRNMARQLIESAAQDGHRATRRSAPSVDDGSPS